MQIRYNSFMGQKLFQGWRDRRTWTNRIIKKRKATALRILFFYHAIFILWFKDFLLACGFFFVVFLLEIEAFWEHVRLSCCLRNRCFIEFLLFREKKKSIVKVKSLKNCRCFWSRSLERMYWRSAPPHSSLLKKIANRLFKFINRDLELGPIPIVSTIKILVL